MHKNYNKFNLLSLLAILFAVFFLVFIYADSETEVSFADPGLESAVRETIEKEDGKITQKDVDTIQVLDASNRHIERLDGIEQLIELRELNLEDNFVKSVTPLKATTKLEDLNLRNNEITSLEAINFQDILYLNIRKLSLRHNVKRDEEGNGTRLSDISLLRQMASLRKLELRDNHIEDLSPLSDLRRLTELDIRENKFESIEPLAVLTRLKELNLRENNIESLEPIKYLSRLTYLNIHSNTTIESLQPIEGLVNLETLIMRNVQIEDNSFLENLTKLQRLNAIDTGIEKTAPETIEGLRRKGALRGDVRPTRMLYTLEAPIFSEDTGFYKEEFALELKNKAADGQIYYTLDGSEPNLNSELYERPINIQEIENTATVVNAKVLDADNRMSETITKSYFVDNAIDERFDLSLFSLVTDPGNLYDENTGLFVEENLQQRGGDWERPIHIEFLDSEGNLKLSQNGGFRLHGKQSRTYEQKSMRIYADTEYDVKNTFNNVFIDDLYAKTTGQKIESLKNFILRNSGQDSFRTKFADGFMQDLAKPIGTFDTQAYVPTVVFLNGDYYGILNIRERLDEHYFKRHYGIDEDDLVILENDASLYRGGTKDTYHYESMLEYIKNNDMTDDKHLDYIETQMDFDSFIDYFGTQIYYANADWPYGNIQFWRKTTDKYIKDAPYGHDGRWRWSMLDTDAGFYRNDDNWWGEDKQVVNHTHNTINWVMREADGNYNRIYPNFLFRNLMMNEKFKNRFLVRFNDLANGYLNEDAANEGIHEKATTIENEIPMHINRWDSIESLDAWYSSIDNKYFFARERPGYIRQYIIEEFNLNGMINVQVNNETNEGYIRLNTIDINADLPGNNLKESWSGTYFAGIPLTIEAIAKEGYEFSHWDDLGSTDEQLEIVPDKDLEIKAVFKEK